MCCCMIPIFPDFKPLELADRDVVESYLRVHPPLASEYTFSNLYAWREIYDYQIAAFREGLLIRRTVEGVTRFLQPLVPSDYEVAVSACLAYLRNHGQIPIIERVSEEVVSAVNWEALGITVNQDRDHCDYVYTVADLLTLEGRKYHAKKNLLHQFTQRYTYRYLPFTSALRQQCLEFAHQWCLDRRCEEFSGMTHENCAGMRLLRHFPRLHIAGGVLLVDDAVVAFTLGEPLNQNTFVIHAEKADTHLTGAYQAIQWEFLRHAVSGHYPFVNREQDLGIPGIRKAKTALHPSHLVMKYQLIGQ